MPEISEFSNASGLMPSLAAPGILAEVQPAPLERPLESLPGAVPTPTVGIEPRALLEELRASQQQAEQAFLQRAQAHAAQAAPEAPSVAAPEPAPHNAEAAAPANEAEWEKHLIFSLGAVRYAVPLDHVIEIAELENLTPVPNLPEWIMGITNLRGDIVSLVDLNVLIGEPGEEAPRGSNLLVAQTKAGDLTTCLVVDRVYGVVNVNPHQIQKLDKVANTVIATHTRGYFAAGQEFLSLLNLEGLLRALELPH